MSKIKVILSFLIISCFLISCDKSDFLEKQDASSNLVDNAKPRKKVIATNYYNVSQWTNTNVNTPGLKEVLAKIVSDQNAGIIAASVIQLNANINCGTASYIVVPSNTTIIGGGSAYGVNGYYLQGNNPINTALFLVTGKNVCFKGLQIRGSYTSYIYRPSFKGITGIYFNTQADSGRIEFCNVYGFSKSAISFLSKNNVVYGNNIHNNYMLNDCGYGVLVSSGGDAIIHDNYFDNNQHAISGGGKSSSGLESGYEAYNNVFQDSQGMMTSHCLDMHGNITDHFAGNKIDIHNNIFYYDAPRTSAIIIRGIPQSYCKVYNNAFVNDPDINSAVRQLFEYYWKNFGDWYVPPSINLNMLVWDNVCNGYPGDPYTTVPWIPGH